MTRIRLLLLALAITIVLAVSVFLAHVAWLWHPLGDCTGTPRQITLCKGQNFWAGISGSNITLPFAAGAIALGWCHQHNCHVHGCPWLSWHPHPEDGHPVCRLHHPHHTAGRIRRLLRKLWRTA